VTCPAIAAANRVGWIRRSGPHHRAGVSRCCRGLRGGELGHWWAGPDRSPDDPTELVADLVGGKVRWPEQPRVVIIWAAP
jgi:hypothetical protein